MFFDLNHQHLGKDLRISIIVKTFLYRPHHAEGRVNPTVHIDSENIKLKIARSTNFFENVIFSL
jgi:hypothetical protein